MRCEFLPSKVLIGNENIINQLNSIWPHVLFDHVTKLVKFEFVM